MIMMDKVISNQFDARMSIQAINDVVNIKIIMRELKEIDMVYDALPDDVELWNTYTGLNRRRNDLCAILHRLITGWE